MTRSLGCRPSITNKAKGATEDSRTFTARFTRDPPDHNRIDSRQTFRIALMKVQEDMGTDLKA